MNIVQARCPHCSNTLRIPADWLDRPMRCKHCKNSFQAKVKGPDVPAPPPPPPVPVPAPVTQKQPVAAPAPTWAPPPSPEPQPTWAAPPSPPHYYPPAPSAPPPGMPASAYYPPGYQAPPPGYAPGYPPPGYPPPGYGPPGYAPGYPPPSADFGFDESQSDVEQVDDAPRPSPKKAKAPVGLIVSAVLLVALIVAGAVFFPQIQAALENKPQEVSTGPKEKEKKVSVKDKQLAEANKKILDQQIAELKEKEKAKNPPTKGGPPTKDPIRPVASGGLPRRALFIAPENYLLLNSTNFYQVREGTGAGENALLYRFAMGAPFNMEKSQIFLLSDSADEKSGGAAPQKDVIEAAIKDFVETSRPQDRIVLFFSGHACDVDGKGYLVPLEGDKDDKDTLIPIDWVYDQLKACKARQKIFIVDAFRFPPARGLELPAPGPMTEAVDKQLDNPPPGVQVVTACLKDQQSLEFERGSLFQSALIEAFRKMALGAIVQPKDTLPIADLVAKANAFMKEELAGGAAMTGKEKDGEAPMTQVCRLSGKEEPGAEANPTEPMPKPVTFLKSDKNGTELTRGILDEIKKFPPMKKSQVHQLAAMSIAALPGGGKDIDAYKEDGFNPFTADAATINAMKDKYPLRNISYEISTKLNEFVDLPMREVLNNPGGPLDAKAKKRFLEEQKDPALATLVLQELLEDAKKIGEKRDEEKSKRWQAHFDLSLARLQSRLVYVYEYNNLLANVRNDSLPGLDDKIHVGWRVNTSPKVQIKDASVKAMAKDAGKIWDRMGTDYPGTPWSVIAKRERNVAMGLQWVPTKN